jgi:hypothetical protein
MSHYNYISATLLSFKKPPGVSARPWTYFLQSLTRGEFNIKKLRIIKIDQYQIKSNDINACTTS